MLLFYRYVIPGKLGSLDVGKRLINWVWYNNYPEGSKEYAELMTDKWGKMHRFTLPIGGMRDDLCAQQKAYATKALPPQFAELVNKAEHPFAQAITDVLSSQVSYFGGKVILIGDAVSGFRPHTAASTSQAALHAMLLDSVFRGEMGLEEWESTVLNYARTVSMHGINLGNRSQFGHHPLGSSRQ